MIDTTVLMKTAKGFDEIQSPTPSLPADLRMVLLMVNGLRNVAGLKVMNEELGRSIAPLVYLEDNGYIEPVPQRGQISLVPEEQMRAGGGGGRRGFGVVPISPPPPPQPPQAREKEASPAPKPSGLVRFFPQRAQPAPAPAATPAPPPPPPTAPPVLRPVQPPAPPPAPQPMLRAAPPPQPAPPPVQQAYPQPVSPPPAPSYQPAPQPQQPQQYRPAPPPAPPAPPQAQAPAPPPAPSTGMALVAQGGGVQNTERVRQLLRYMSRIMGADAPPVLKKIQAVQTETELNIMVNRLVTIVRYYRGAVESEQFADHFGP